MASRMERQHDQRSNTVVLPAGRDQQAMGNQQEPAAAWPAGRHQEPQSGTVSRPVGRNGKQNSTAAQRHDKQTGPVAQQTDWVGGTASGTGGSGTRGRPAVWEKRMVRDKQAGQAAGTSRQDKLSGAQVGQVTHLTGKDHLHGHRDGKATRSGLGRRHSQRGGTATQTEGQGDWP